MNGGGNSPPDEVVELLTRDFILLSIASVLFMGSLYLVIPVLPLYMVDVAGASTTQVGLMMGALTVSSMLLRPYIGKLTDRTGRKPLMLAGGAIFIAASLLYMVCGNIASITVVVILHGAGIACFHTASLAFAGDIAPPLHRGKSMSWFQASFNVAIMLAPLLGMYLADRTGFNSVFICAASAAAASLPILVVLSEKKVRAVAVTSGRGGVAERRLLALVCVAAFAGTVTLGAAEAFMALFTQSRGIPHFAVFFTISAAVLILLRFTAGSLPDILGRRVMTTFALFTLGCSMFVLAVARSFATLCVAALIHGIGFAFHAPTVSALLIDKVNREELGAAFGIYTAAFEGGIAFGSIVMGPVSGSLGYGWSFFIVGLICVAGGLFVSVSYGRMTR